MKRTIHLKETELKQMIREHLYEVVSKKEHADLYTAFNLKKILKEELKSQYYDINLFLNHTNSCLTKDENNNFILEAKERTASPEKVKNELSVRYGIHSWQINIIKSYHDIKVMVCIGDIGQNVDTIVKDMEYFGYFLAHYFYSTDIMGDRWCHLKFEPRYQDANTENITKYNFLYHITPFKNLSLITKEGLKPKSENKVFLYPNRIYVLVGNYGYDEIYSLCNLFQRANSENDGKYAVLKIDVHKLPNHINFYDDPNSKYGAFIEQSIPSNCIVSYEIINVNSNKIENNNKQNF